MAAVSYLGTQKAASAILEKWEDMEQDTRMWRPLWQEVADFTFPERSNIQITRHPSQQRTLKMLDSTAMHAKNLLAASMQGALTSSAFMWFGLRIRGIELSRDHQVNKWLEWCAQDMYDAIEESNFQSESHEMYLDVPVFGTAAMLVGERTPSLTTPPGSIVCTALSPGKFNIDENEEGRVDTVFRKFKLSARAAVQAYDVCGKQVMAAVNGNRAAERYEFIHAIYPRTDVRIGSSRPLPATKMPYASVTVDVSGQCVVRDSGYDRLPVMVPRWSKDSDETWGTGPGIVALPDIKTLNKAVELKLKAWAKVVDPPIKARHQGVVGAVRLFNGGITYVRDMDAIAPLSELGGRLDIADMEEEKKRDQIRRIFYADQLQLQQGPQMTAYEVQVRYELMQRILGPTMGRMNVEYLNPFIERVFWIRLNASDKNSPYRMLEAWCKQNHKVLDIEYEGPLAKAQRVQESIAVQRTFQLVLPLVQTKPDVMDNFDLDEASVLIAESNGLPARILRDPKERDAIRQARTAATEQKNQQDAALQASETGKNIAPLLTAMAQQRPGQPGSILPQPSPVLAGGGAG
jgi:hypothetical protein